MKPRRLITQAEMTEVIAAYESGDSIKTIAERHKVARHMIHSRLVKYGVKLRPSGRPAKPKIMMKPAPNNTALSTKYLSMRF